MHCLLFCRHPHKTSSSSVLWSSMDLRRGVSPRRDCHHGQFHFHAFSLSPPLSRMCRSNYLLLCPHNFWCRVGYVFCAFHKSTRRLLLSKQRLASGPMLPPDRKQALESVRLLVPRPLIFPMIGRSACCSLHSGGL